MQTPYIYIFKDKVIINKKEGYTVPCLSSNKHILVFCWVSLLFLYLFSSLLSKGRAFYSDVSALIKGLCVVLWASSVTQWLRISLLMQERQVQKIPWRRKWQPTPVFLPEKCHGQMSFSGYSPWVAEESDMTGQLSNSNMLYNKFSDIIVFLPQLYFPSLK